jgi:hypothetical protein
MTHEELMADPEYAAAYRRTLAGQAEALAAALRALASLVLERPSR